MPPLKPNTRPPDPLTPPHLWRSLAEQDRPVTGGATRTDEFPAGASHWPEALSRRRFLEVMGSSLAMAGATGCGRPPPDKILPYVTRPEQAVPGEIRYYATAMPWQGFARGVLAASRLGRPTKLEGNPDHSESLGATDTVTQAAVLDLYDPDRSRVPRLRGRPAAWEHFENEWLERRRQLAAEGGAGAALLTEPTTSPTVLRLVHRFLELFPQARWFQHTALARYDSSGWQRDFDPAAADVVVAVDDDFLHAHPASLRFARAFAARRRAASIEEAPLRLYAIEPTPTVTGSMADHRLPASPSEIHTVLHAIASALGVPGLNTSQAGELAGDARTFARHAATDLRAAGSRAAVLAGPDLEEATRALADQINEHLGTSAVVRHAAVRSDADARAAGELPDLAWQLADGSVHTLLCFDSNPVYTAPADVDFASALARAEFTLHHGLHVDETGTACRWHLPASHFLESWCDLRGYDGRATIVQPLIEPLFRTRTTSEVLDFCANPPGASDYELVRATWRSAVEADEFESHWSAWLKIGVVEQPQPAPQPSAAPRARSHVAAAPSEPTTDTVLFRADPNVHDGRWANNAWLQEIPRPISHLVWDNAALVSPEMAARHQLINGDMVALTVGKRTLEAPIWIQPGQAARCITLHLGYGRRRGGKVCRDSGFDAFRLRTTEHLSHAPLVGLRRTGGRYELVSTQSHFAMEGRDLVRVVALADSRAAEPTSNHKPPPAPEEESLFPAWERSRYAWGMVIDLGVCIGCNACTIACQAENNIPSVGKEQVARGREMHWIRVDRYYGGDPARPLIVHQPVPCMHCEIAPCELVCPVHATVHSSEGLNDMVYNRCIGTRYCSNNCPYKVRRFNFLDYQPDAKALATLQQNPDVTVRARGVMEKCTYCVQRINAARIVASRERRAIHDGEVQTACQQVCPTQAIVFGDLQTPGSRVAAARADARNYALLPELNTHPRTTYLARVANPAADEAASSA